MVKTVFDPSQDHQRAAIKAVFNLFEGQPMRAGSFDLQLDVPGALFTEYGLGNNIIISEERLRRNLEIVQADPRNHVPEGDRSALVESGAIAEDLQNFSIEMETGTGKTYVYLRTILEMWQHFGWTKFVVVVPSVAIREGVVQSVRQLDHHFKLLYDISLGKRTRSYSAGNVDTVRNFAASRSLEVLVITNDSFNKSSNLLKRTRESGRPTDWIASTNPIVILDEPQKMEGAATARAIQELRPFSILRYSATHKHYRNLVYRLDPVRAYNLGLVKQISVASVLERDDRTKPLVRVLSFKALKNDVVATLEIRVSTSTGATPSTVRISKGNRDLFELSRGREEYQDWVVEDIIPSDGEVIFSNGQSVTLDSPLGVDRDPIMRAQIRMTVRRHLERELVFHRKFGSSGSSFKVLSLFFIDKVSNFVTESGRGKLQEWFREEYLELSSWERYSTLALPSVDEVYGSYFSKIGASLADTSGDTSADAEVYDRILRNKEKLLDRSDQLRFIFTHSALREGWDNPNVFQICTLNQSLSSDRKRQEIGRGLRLAVNQNGERTIDPSVNELTIVANEHYEDYARALQAELREEGATSAVPIRPLRERLKVSLDDDFARDESFNYLWNAIARPTRYRVAFSTGALIARAVQRLKARPSIGALDIRGSVGRLTIQEGGAGRSVTAVRSGADQVLSTSGRVRSLPDVLSRITRETGVTRRTVAEIVRDSGRVGDLLVNPGEALEMFSHEIRAAVEVEMIEGVIYTPEDYDADLIDEEALAKSYEGERYADKLVAVQGSIVDYIATDSAKEAEIALALDERSRRRADADLDADIDLFLKLPNAFFVDTPAGRYTPDWAVLHTKRDDGSIRLVVAESKGSSDEEDLRARESRRIKAARKHFDAIGVEFLAPVDDAELL